MTKKTDSLIFRYGIQTLWKNTDFLFKTSVSSSFFFKFLQFELQRFNFELLAIEQKKSNFISIFVFCFFWKNDSNFLEKRQVASYFKIVFFYQYWFLFQILYTFFNLSKIEKLNLLTLNSLVYLTKKSVKTFDISKRDFNYFIKIKSLSTLFFKVEQLRLETCLSLFFNRHFYLKLHNIFNLPVYFDFLRLLPFNKSSVIHNLNTLEFMLYLSCKLRIAGVFARYLAKKLELERRHRKVLWSAVNAINTLGSKLSLFKGIRIYVTGKLNGKMRRKTYSFKYGILKIHQINSNLDYFKTTSFTKFGTMSVKVWIFF